MSSRFRSAIGALACGAAIFAVQHAHAGERVVRFCVDPDNLPYSDASGAGFEVQIARIVAADLHARAEFVWLLPRRGMVRKTLGAGVCDVIPGVPVGLERVLATHPYYRSTYAFVTRHAGPASFDDTRLAHARIGVQLVGEDLAATPPGHALTAHGVIDNVRGYAVYGDGPAARRMVEALAAGELDTAIIWGPQAGYFARHAGVALEVHATTAPAWLHGIPFEYSIAMGVKRGNAELRDEIDGALARRRDEIRAVLAGYGVPLVERPGGRS
jgi:quinoprotein dehydrogenase-associated probable ABC transporter substrate-binding protein